VARIWRNECFVKDQRRVFQACFHIADFPFFARLAQRQTAILGILEVLASPLDCLEFGGRHRRPLAGLRRRRWHTHPGVPIYPRVRAAWPQSFKWIDHEWQTLKIDFNFFNGIGAVSSSTAATARIG